MTYNVLMIDNFFECYFFAVIKVSINFFGFKITSEHFLYCFIADTGHYLVRSISIHYDFKARKEVSWQNNQVEKKLFLKQWTKKHYLMSSIIIWVVSIVFAFPAMFKAKGFQETLEF